MNIKKIGISLLTIGTAIALGSCNNNPAKDDNLMGQKFFYNGYFGDVDITEGTNETFNKVIEYFFSSGGMTQFNYTISDNLIQYKVDHVVHKFTDDKKLNFSTAKVTEPRKLKDNTPVETYLINPVGDKSLCEYAPVNGKENVYRLYDVIDGVCDDHYALIRQDWGSDATLLVHTEEVSFNKETKMVNIALVLEGSYTEYDQQGQGHTDEFAATYSIDFGDGPADEVKIAAQPKDITVDYPNAVDLSFEVLNEDKVIGYQWYCGAYISDFDGSYGPLEGTDTHDKHLHLDGIGCAQKVIPFKCLIKTANREFFTSVAVVNVNKTDVFVPTAFILDIPIKAGETLDLSTTPYGTGTIKYDANGHDFTFTNVNFNNEHQKSNRENIAFSIQTWHNPHSEYNFNFVGQNVFYNSYWESAEQGGYTFFMHFAKKDDETVKIPDINFKGDPVTFIGGTGSIWTNAYLNIYNNINMVGLPKRLSKGIIAGEVNVKSGAIVTGALGGAIFFTEKYNVNIEEGSTVNAVINCGAVNVGEVQQFGISSAGDLNIKNANVNVIFNIDFQHFLSRGETIVPLAGIYSHGGSIGIENSTVNVKTNVINEPKSDVKVLADSCYGMGARCIEIKNSKVDIDVASLQFINVSGINCSTFYIENSKLDVNVKGYTGASGIVSQFVPNDPNQPGDLEVHNSIVNVKTFAYEKGADDKGEYWYVDAGIRATNLILDLGQGYVNIETNEASAIVCGLERVNDKPIPVKGYVPTNLILDNVDVVSDSYVVNLDYYKGFNIDTLKGYKVKLEALYTDDTYSHYLTSILLLPKSE